MTGEGMATMPEPNIQILIQVEDECDGFINEATLSGKARDVPPMVWIVAVLWAAKFWFLGA